LIDGNITRVIMGARPAHNNETTMNVYNGRHMTYRDE